ncbi:ATP-binding protein [uncultured Parolsenella sp.]|uniref:ATP-binding protein n=1 Tax=uncultured Parolsenella sp. TaxID=2083008 RepID=UPI0027DD5825|nr:ATP-binding protein [uncultured Parolsenella sp.]
MYRSLMKDLTSWKTRPNRKPLILQGARQVGKTWLALELGRTEFSQVAHVVFLDNEPMKAVFEGSLNPTRLLAAIAAETSTRAGDSDVLIVLDEVQECPRALTALKLFCEQRPDTPIIAAGSLLGVALHNGVSFPVGKVEHLDVYPMTFYEYLRATDTTLADLLDASDLTLVDAYSERFTDALRSYYYVGGMPEAVAAYAETGDYAETRKTQNRLLYDYEHDFSKHATPILAERIREVWKSAPSQLARENKKFVYTAVRPGARARNFEEAISWLVDAGLLCRVNRVSKPGLPLDGYRDLNAFKLYFLDVGLLGAASGLDLKTIVSGSALFEEFKGALTEQFVCQQFVATGELVPCYWSAENSTGEVDFLYDYGGRVVPVEVKAETNLKGKSLSSFAKKYGIDRSLRLSLAGFRDQGWVVNVPLYATNLLPGVFEAISAD